MWKLFISDVSIAFLQGDPQTRILWAKIPKDACQLIGVPPGTFMKLLKPIYGQADAPRQWFVVARRRLISIGYKPHALDQCLYLLHHGQDFISMIGLHVNDLLGGGDENHERYQEAKQRLKANSPSSIGANKVKMRRWSSVDVISHPVRLVGCFIRKSTSCR